MTEVTEFARCPRCGNPLSPVEGPRRGPRRIWCSDTCRRTAHTDRAAAARAGAAVQVVEVPRRSPAVWQPVIVPRPLTSAEAADRVLTDPDACTWVLHALTTQARGKKLDRRVLDAARELARVLLPHQSRY